jgi:hypothetical protein
MAGKGADATDLDDVARFTTTVQAGEFVFREGEAASDVFIVQEGRVGLVTTAGAAEGVVDAGGFFGEGGLFGAASRDVSAQALTDVRLLRLDRAAFDRVVAEAPQVAVSMLEQLSRRAGADKVVLREAVARAASAGANAAAAVAAPPPVERGEPSLVEVESGTSFALAGLEDATVGRPDRGTGFVPEIDLMPLDEKRTLSRRHAKLARRDGRWFVREEAGTRNGTFVNGTRITTGTEVELHDGDQVQFGFVRMVFQWR